VRPGHRKGARGGREEAPEVAGPKQEDAEQSQATEENVARQIVDSSIGWLERTIESDAYFKGVRRNSLEAREPCPSAFTNAKTRSGISRFGGSTDRDEPQLCSGRVGRLLDQVLEARLSQ
jgi:hypothetical protein